jgi:hypothetical protein
LESEGDESSVAKVRRMMKRMFNEMKEEINEDIQKQCIPREMGKKNLRRHRNNKMNSVRILTNSKTKPRKYKERDKKNKEDSTKYEKGA